MKNQAFETPNLELERRTGRNKGEKEKKETLRIYKGINNKRKETGKERRERKEKEINKEREVILRPDTRGQPKD